MLVSPIYDNVCEAAAKKILDGWLRQRNRLTSSAVRSRFPHSESAVRWREAGVGMAASTALRPSQAR